MKKFLVLLCCVFMLFGCAQQSQEEERLYDDVKNEENEKVEDNEKVGKVISVPEDYSSISEAIINASDFDKIIVSPGTYNEDVNFSGKNIEILSTNPMDDSVVEATIINGTGNGPVVRIDSGEESAVLSGFTITNGNYTHGGGINIGPLSQFTTAKISNNIIRNNKASYGGGIYIQMSSSDILNNKFIDNEATMSGGGLHLASQANVVVENNTFTNNTAGTFGGALHIAMSSPIIKNNDFNNNSAEIGGGAIVINEQGNPALEGNSFSNNTPDDVSD